MFENRFILDVGISRVLRARDACLQRDQLETSKNDRNLSFLVVVVMESLFNWELETRYCETVYVCHNFSFSKRKLTEDR
jgi:hypothetical protein